MCINFFENMYRILVFIRADIYHSNNIKFVKVLLFSINEELTNSVMAERIFCISSELKHQLILQDGDICIMSKEAKDFALSSLHILCKELEEKRYDFAYDMADMLHAFPHVIICNDKKQIRNYWRTYVKPIMKKNKLKKGDLNFFKKGRI